MSRIYNGFTLNAVNDPENNGQVECDILDDILDFLPDYGELGTDRHHHYKLYGPDEGDEILSVESDGSITFTPSDGVAQINFPGTGADTAYIQYSDTDEYLTLFVRTSGTVTETASLQLRANPNTESVAKITGAVTGAGEDIQGLLEIMPVYGGLTEKGGDVIGMIFSPPSLGTFDTYTPLSINNVWLSDAAPGGTNHKYLLVTVPNVGSYKIDMLKVN